MSKPILAFDTFRKIGPREASQWTHDEPDCFNGIVTIRKYRVTVQEIEEPIDVLKARLVKLWEESDNFHHAAQMKAVAADLGLELDYNTRGTKRKKTR